MHVQVTAPTEQAIRRPPPVTLRTIIAIIPDKFMIFILYPFMPLRLTHAETNQYPQILYMDNVHFRRQQVAGPECS